MMAIRQLVVIAILTLFGPSVTQAENSQTSPVVEKIERLKTEVENLKTRLDTAESQLSTILELIVKLPRNVVLTSSTFRTSFDGVTSWRVIPNSENAIYCSLSRVDDDAPAGSCYVRHEDGRWKYLAGGGSNVNHCEVVCLEMTATLE